MSSRDANGWIARMQMVASKKHKVAGSDTASNTLLDIQGNTVRPSPRHIFEDKLLKRARSGVNTNPRARRST